MRKKRALVPLCLAVLLSLSGCEEFFNAIGGFYGELEGADQTGELRPGDPEFESILEDMSGVWYSHYAGMGRLDGYRIGKVGSGIGNALPANKLALFPDALLTSPSWQLLCGSDTSADTSCAADDYYIFYDDTVYGQNDDGTGGNGGWGSLVTRYVGIVRAVNIFNNDPKRGAIIIQYFQGASPTWDKDLANGSHPFFGIYYRVLSPDVVQMANAVDLAALYAGESYYTETATLDEAITNNRIENEAEYISWGVVIPQDREKN
jgi:hypothetical protein